MKKEGPEDLALFIADKGGRTIEDNLKVILSELRKQGAPIGKPEKLNHVIETIHFAASHECFFIQIVDCCAYIIRRIYEGRNDKYTSLLYQIIKDRICSSVVFP